MADSSIGCRLEEKRAGAEYVSMIIDTYRMRFGARDNSRPSAPRLGTAASGLGVAEQPIAQGAAGTAPEIWMLRSTWTSSAWAERDKLRVAMIGELPSQASEDARLGLDLEKRAAVGADRSTVEATHHHAFAKAVQLQLLCATLCRRRAVLLVVHNGLIAQPLCPKRRPFFNPLVRFPG